MRVLSFNFSHDASVSVIEDGELSFYSMEERISRKKHASFPFYSLLKAKKKYKNFDLFVINGLHCGSNDFLHVDYWYKFLLELDCGANTNNIIIENQHHHTNHARTSFYHSGFEDALCIVLDGAGNIFEDVLYDGIACRELETIFYASKPNKFDTVYKRFFTGTGRNNYKDVSTETRKVTISDGSVVDVEFSSYPSVGWEYEICNSKVGFGEYDSGKSMGLSQCINHLEMIDESWYDKSVICSETQEKTFERSLHLIKKYLKEYDTNNVIISGGYGLNCVSNYRYMDHMDVNIFVDPMCDDCGISVGAGLYHYYENTKDFRHSEIKNVYLGHEESDYNLDGLNVREVTEEDVVNLLIDQNVIALFQGKSESGPRALGNRSIICDPRIRNGKDLMNKIKKRENFRPFGATVLQEKVNEWFDMKRLESSPFMMYAIKCHDHKMNEIPSVLHVDGTSRIQTVTEEQNKNFYRLIKEFDKKTNVPLLLNTSFNLNGEPIVETFEDSLKTFFNSEIDFLYLPDINKIVCQYPMSNI